MVCNSLGKWRQASLRLRRTNAPLGSIAHAAAAASNTTIAIPIAKYILNTNLADASRLLPYHATFISQRSAPRNRGALRYSPGKNQLYFRGCPAHITRPRAFLPAAPL